MADIKNAVPVVDVVPAGEAAVPATATENKIYKGEPKTLDEFSQMGISVVQRIGDKDIMVKNYGRQEVPRIAVLYSVRPTHDKNLVSARFFSFRDEKFTEFTRYLPKDLKLQKLTGTKGQDVMSRFEEFRSNDFGRFMTSRLARNIGSDPEIFVEDSKGEIIPAFKFLGSKERPNISPKPTQHGGYPMYWDGFQAEMVVHADTCLAWVTDSMQAGLQGILQAARAIDPKAKLSSKTLVEIPYEVLQSTAPEYVEFGCRPSFNVYGLKGDLDAGGRNIAARSVGGHIHLGIGKQSDKDVENIVRALDAVLGVSCVSLFEGYDSPIRRQYYGLAGEYRLPPHGIEYRALSNAWIYHPAITNLVFDLSRNVANMGHSDMLSYWKATEAETVETMMNCDVERAREIVKRNEKVLKALLGMSYGTFGNGVEEGFNTILKGMNAVLKDPTNIELNWSLNSQWVSHCDGPNKNWNHASASIHKGEKV